MDHHKSVYVGMSANLVHPGHLNVIKKAENLTKSEWDFSPMKRLHGYKRVPFMTFDQRREVIESIKGLSRVVLQTTLDYEPNLEQLKPDYLVHRGDWKKGTSKRYNNQQGNKLSGLSLQLKHFLALENITYTYPNASCPALSKTSLNIPAMTTVGIVSGTGAGKTTLLDIILGLLPPVHGRILVDGLEITLYKTRSWQHILGYVLQHIYLSDESISANIVFGIPEDKILFNAFTQAAKTAALHEFILQDLPKGCDSMVGESGIRLSGGQRQRISIACAMYHNPSVLILDEATSALDNATERACHP